MAPLTGPLIIELLLAAAGVAFNPPAIIAAIVLASSSRPKAMAFAGGWLAGLLAIGSVVMLVGDAGELLGEPSTLALIAKLVLGAVLVIWALAKWRKQSRASGADETPSWMGSLTGLSPPRAFVVAAAYAFLNPKTLAFVVAGVLTILGASSGVAVEWITLMLFLVLASLSVTLPVAFSVIAPHRSAESLAAARLWLGDNGSMVTAAVLAVLGALLLYSAIAGLLQLA
ncbi:MAG: GAP family protein [Coriobacteriia bacterium]|nr:GAP family protein [Coriobacteriia bacterium]